MFHNYNYIWHIDVLCLFDFITGLYGWFISSLLFISFPYTLYLSCVYSEWQTHGLCHVVIFMSIIGIWHIAIICHATTLRGHVVVKDYICYWYAVFPGLYWCIREEAGEGFIPVLITLFYILSIVSLYLSCIQCRLYLY